MHGRTASRALARPPCVAVQLPRPLSSRRPRTLPPQRQQRRAHLSFASAAEPAPLAAPCSPHACATVRRCTPLKPGQAASSPLHTCSRVPKMCGEAGPWRNTVTGRLPAGGLASCRSGIIDLAFRHLLSAAMSFRAAKTYPPWMQTLSLQNCSRKTSAAWLRAPMAHADGPPLRTRRLLVLCPQEWPHRRRARQMMRHRGVGSLGELLRRSNLLPDRAPLRETLTWLRSSQAAQCARSQAAPRRPGPIRVLARHLPQIPGIRGQHGRPLLSSCRPLLRPLPRPSSAAAMHPQRARSMQH